MAMSNDDISRVFANLEELQWSHDLWTREGLPVYDGYHEDEKNLISGVVMLGLRHFHYEAYEVCADNTHVTVCQAYQGRLDHVIALCGADESREQFRTIEVAGRFYVEFLIPFTV